MSDANVRAGDEPEVETVTLSEARRLIRAMAHRQSILLLSPPGVGKSDTVALAAEEAGLETRSLLGTQIAPEDVSGVPRIVGERSVFCPPRVLLPEDPRPFCLFLDELPAASPEIQKALYSLLLERRLGEHRLPPGTWVVAAGNRTQDRALVRAMSTALINRVFVLNVRVDVKEWLAWARAHGVRQEIVTYILYRPGALTRSIPTVPAPFSTPRAWASLSEALELVERDGPLEPALVRALASGRVSAEDAAVFCALFDQGKTLESEPVEYLRDPARLPEDGAARWVALQAIRRLVGEGGVRPRMLKRWHADRFLGALPPEQRFTLLVDLVPAWAALGAAQSLLDSLREVVDG